MTCNHLPKLSCPTCRPELWNPITGAADTIQWLATKILEAKIAYYDLGTPTMSDPEYDAIEKTLRAYAPNHPALRQVGSQKPTQPPQSIPADTGG